MSWKTPLAKKLAHLATARPGILGQLLRQPALREAVAKDDKLLEALLKRSLALQPERGGDGRPPWFDAGIAAQKLSEKELAAEVQRRKEAGKLDGKVLVAALDEKQVVHQLGAGRILPHLKTETLLDHAGPEKAVRHFGPQTLLGKMAHRDIAAALPPSKAYEHMGFESLFGEFVKHQGALRDAFLKHEELLKALFNDEEVMKLLLSERSFRERLAVARAHETAGRLNWPYPAVVCSFPRAGSNFLQSILLHSSGMNNQSIYGRKNLFKPSEYTLTVKSHAPSPEYLFEEYRRKVEWPERPDRVILLQRDPRDVMISFFEYTQTNREITLNQAEFLHGVDYFYASTIDPDNERKMYTASLTVAEAFREHVRTWFVECPETLNCLVVRYEDLLEHAEEAFQRIFDFLGIDCRLAHAFLNVKVSLYGQAKRARGIAGGWRNAYENYQVLIDAVNAEFGKELDMLGYTAADAEA